MDDRRVLGGKELKDAIAEVLADGLERTSNDLHVALRAKGLEAIGSDYKGRIRNIYSGAAADPRIEKVKSGVFALRPS